MAIYHINILLLLLWAALLCIYKPSKKKDIVFLCLAFGQMLLLSALRNGIGWDFDAYSEGFLAISELPFATLQYANFEPGFVLFNHVVALFTKDPMVFLIVCAVLLLGITAWFIYKYSKNVWVSTYLFVTLTFFYSTMNLIRQNFAMVILFFSYKFLKERKIVPYMLIVLLAASFHKTALIMIPVYFIAALKPTKKVLCIYGALTVVAYLLADPIIDFVTQFVYTGYRGSMYDVGLSPVFVIIPFLVAALGIIFKEKLIAQNKDNVFLINMMIFAAVLWLFITKFFLIERVSWYMYCYVLIFIPEFLSLFSSENEEKRKEELRLKIEENKKLKRGTKSLEDEIRRIDAKKKTMRGRQIAIVASVLAITWCYNLFGMYDGINGFHGVFPYKTENSVINHINQFFGQADELEQDAS